LSLTPDCIRAPSRIMAVRVAGHHNNILALALPVCSQRRGRSWPACHPNSPPSVAVPSTQRRGPVRPASRPFILIVRPASRPHPPSVTAGRSRLSSTSHPSVISSSQRHGGSWLTILVLVASREVVDGHPRPPRVTGDHGKPSSSSHCQGRSWIAILVLPM